MCWIASSLPRTNHSKSTRNIEESIYYQCLRTEELLHIFPLVPTYAKVANSARGKVVIDSCLPCPLFKKIATPAVATGKPFHYSSLLLPTFGNT